MGLIEQLPELADEMKLIRSPIDDKIVVVSVRDGHEVCQYCFKRFDERVPELSSIEMAPKMDSGEPGTARVKVHGHCRDLHGRELPTIQA
jgi:hypothetical protein